MGRGNSAGKSSLLGMGMLSGADCSPWARVITGEALTSDQVAQSSRDGWAERASSPRARPVDGSKPLKFMCLCVLEHGTITDWQSTTDGTRNQITINWTIASI